MSRVSLFFVLCAVSTVAAAAAPIDSRVAELPVTVTVFGNVSTQFICRSSTTGVCNYRILSPLCNEKMLADGAKSKTCHYSEPVPPFQLKQGQSKSVTSLPADFIYTMKVDTPPTPAECLSAPIAH